MITENQQPEFTWIGMICRIGSMPKLEEHTYTWIFRILVVDLELAKHNAKIICYTPADVNPNDQTVSGLILEGTQFKKMTLPLPKVNYDYYFGSPDESGKSGFTYEDFEPWAINKGYAIYPEKSLRELACDKLLSAALLSQCDKSMIPHTEIFRKESSQIEHFLHNKSCVFIKPQYGSSGNDIFVIKRENLNYRVEHYFEGEKNAALFPTLPDCLPFLQQNDKGRKYIIQEAVDCLRYEGSVFDIRVILFKDGHTWHFLTEIRVGAKGKEISNLSQGGDSLTAEIFFNKLFSKEKVPVLLEKIRTSSEKMADFLNNHLNDKITEIALDVLIDANENIYLAEINIKPGLLGGFTMYDHFFDMSAHEKYIFETQAKKHGEYLAKSLLYRCRGESL